MPKIFASVKPTLTPDSICVEVNGKHHVLITRTDEGVVVDVFQLPYGDSQQADDADATCYSFDKQEE